MELRRRFSCHLRNHNPSQNDNLCAARPEGRPRQRQESGAEAAGGGEGILKAGNGGEGGNQIGEQAIDLGKGRAAVGCREHRGENKDNLKKGGRFSEQAGRKRAIA